MYMNISKINEDDGIHSSEMNNGEAINIVSAIKDIVRHYFNKDNFEIFPCGNHKLNRNLVYILLVDDEKYVIKFFFMNERYNRELQVIPLAESINPLKIIVNGETANGLDWVIYNYLEGWLLEHIYDDLDLDQLRDIFYQIGEKLAQFHSIKKYDYFGDWNENKRSPVEDYHKFMVEECERMISNLVFEGTKDDVILKTAVDRLRAEYVNIRKLNSGRLCHRDMDGRNILIHVNLNEGIKVGAFLDFEKTVVFNEYFDIISLYKKYFIYEPKLIEPFFKGYEKILPIDASFDTELRFNLYRIGIDICSWSKEFSEPYYDETLKYLKKLESVDDMISTIFAKPNF